MARRKSITKKLGSLFKKGVIAPALKVTFKLLPYLLVVAIIGIGLKVAASFIINSEYFRIKNIRIIGEKTDTRPDSLVRDLGLRVGDNIFSVDLRRCESIIDSKYPERQYIKIRRIMPDTLEISYMIRRPFCQVDSGSYYPVSEDAVILPNPAIIARPDLPVITGIDIPPNRRLPERHASLNALRRAIAILRDINESGLSKRLGTVMIDMYDISNPAIILDDGTRIEIGEYSFKERQRLLKEVLDDLETKSRGAKVIDLRFKDVVVVPR